MKNLIGKCANCGKSIWRGYLLSAARKSRRMYCSSDCQVAGSKKAWENKRQKYFWTKVDKRKADECWPWIGFKDQNGYGKYGRIPAHRIAYQITFGEIPSGLCVCHSCDNPICANPNHLWLGTHAENMADMAKKGRQKSNPRRGEKHPRAKITQRQALLILSSNKPNAELARRFGVSRTAINYIKMGKNWAHIHAS